MQRYHGDACSLQRATVALWCAAIGIGLVVGGAAYAAWSEFG
jgi:hypothetical protein